MKKLLFYVCIFLITFSGCSQELPIYKLEKNADSITIDGNDYAVHKLRYENKLYLSEAEQEATPSKYSKLKLGKQVGRTKDDLQIYEVKGNKQRLALKGLMFPETFFKQRD
ncbi:hypothetical protein [Priestia megaterium]|uniref:Lipoprotein n=1 Tax=Priestia megaterium TaxID=1404 RepID=A0A6M6DYC5_PRIMG|nr:hypothetical protein [Priestia megaterium]QJX79921.1 hypothetical protein FDZ14_27865 [Priestia megaterium]